MQYKKILLYLAWNMLLVGQHNSILSLRDISFKCVAGSLATLLQQAAYSAKSPDEYISEVKKINTIVQSIPEDIAKSVVQLMLTMVDRINCKDPKRRDSLFYLHCLSEGLSYKKLYKPRSLKKIQRLKRWPSIGYFDRQRLVISSFQKKLSRGKLNSLIQSGIINNGELKELLAGEISFRNKFAKDINPILSKWKKSIEKKRLGRHSGQFLYHHSLDRSAIIALFLHYNVINFFPLLRDYVFKIYDDVTNKNYDVKYNYFDLLRIYKDQHHDDPFIITDKILLHLFLLKRKFGRDYVCSHLTYFLYTLFRKQPEQCCLSISDVIALFCPKQHDKRMLCNSTIPYIFNKYAKKLWNRKSLIICNDFIANINSIININNTLLCTSSNNYRLASFLDMSFLENTVIDHDQLLTLMMCSDYWLDAERTSLMISRTKSAILLKFLDAIKNLCTYENLLYEQKVLALRDTLTKTIASQTK